MKNIKNRRDEIITNTNKTVSANPFPAPKTQDAQLCFILMTIILWHSC